VSGVVLLLFLTAHMVGNLEIFFGQRTFDGYAAWLRTIGEPVLHHGWYLWLQRAVLLVAVAAHVVAAAQLSSRDRRARRVRYAHHLRPRASFATRTMRWGGVIVALFIVWHLLDLTVGVANPSFRDGDPYHNVLADFQVWWINVLYVVPLVLLGLHVNHGFFSAAQTLGVNRPARARAIRITGTTVATVLAGGFILVPVAVLTGLVG
jgi:succinate dehydrogenase / fumarate reductase cytochrome b subunit